MRVHILNIDKNALHQFFDLIVSSVARGLIVNFLSFSNEVNKKVEIFLLEN